MDDFSDLLSSVKVDHTASYVSLSDSGFLNAKWIVVFIWFLHVSSLADSVYVCDCVPSCLLKPLSHYGVC